MHLSNNSSRSGRVSRSRVLALIALAIGGITLHAAPPQPHLVQPGMPGGVNGGVGDAPAVTQIVAVYRDPAKSSTLAPPPDAAPKGVVTRSTMPVVPLVHAPVVVDKTTPSANAAPAPAAPTVEILGRH